VTADPGPVGRAALGAACAIIDATGRILLVRHTYGRLNWELPGGACLPDESPAAGARRELEEETTLRVDSDGTLTGVYFEPGHDFGPVLHFVFRFDVLGSVEPVAQPPEIGAVGWFAVNDLPRPISDFTEQRIRDAVAARASFGVVNGRQWRD
jgi:8-oxo-dGTP pyrophosphatase MutT (NUDIX family)